ncbi:MAG: hypothetical protein AMXMBFR58_21710 [Phycisphaerae bacterium]
MMAAVTSAVARALGLGRTTMVARTAGRDVSRDGLFMELERRIAFSVAPDNHTIVKFDTAYGDIYVELFDDVAPITVANFLSYINTDRLNETFFHRMIKKQNNVGIDILQGGGFYFEDGDGEPTAVTTDAPIVLETTGKSNVRGTIAMARTSVPNSATSGFYFNVQDNLSLDPTGPNTGYAVFGQVVMGMDVIDQIFALRTFDLDGSNSQTYDDVVVTSHYNPNSSGGVTEADLVYLTDASVVNRAEYRAVAGSPVDGAVNAQDQLIISALGLNGRAEVFSPDSEGQWQYQNLTALTGSPTLTGNIEVFYDPKTGLKHAVGPSLSGLILFTQSAAGSWSYTNLTTTVAGGQIIEGEVTVFTTTDGFVYVAGMADNGDLVAFRQTGTATSWVWEFHNFSTQDLAPRGLDTPAFTGRLTSFVTAWNGLNIVGLDGNGEIQAIWWAPGIDQNLWTSTNLSDAVGAPKFTGGLTVYLTSWFATNIVGITEEGHVSATWWVATAGGGDELWRTSDLTALFDGPLLVGNTISSFVTPWGATNIGGLDSNGKLYVYWWAPASGAGNWTVTDMSTAVPAGTKPMVGRITGVTSPANTINLVGTASNGDVMRYYWSPVGDQLWKADDVSYLASLNS